MVEPPVKIVYVCIWEKIDKILQADKESRRRQQNPPKGGGCPYTPVQHMFACATMQRQRQLLRTLQCVFLPVVGSVRVSAILVPCSLLTVRHHSSTTFIFPCCRLSCHGVVVQRDDTRRRRCADSCDWRTFERKGFMAQCSFLQGLFVMWNMVVSQAYAHHYFEPKFSWAAPTIAFLAIYIIYTLPFLVSGLQWILF